MAWFHFLNESKQGMSEISKQFIAADFVIPGLIWLCFNAVSSAASNQTEIKPNYGLADFNC